MSEAFVAGPRGMRTRWNRNLAEGLKSISFGSGHGPGHRLELYIAEPGMGMFRFETADIKARAIAKLKLVLGSCFAD